MKKKTPLTEAEQDRAKLLRASGKTPTAIARTLGHSHHTISKFLDKPEVREQVNIQREELARMFDQVAHRVVSSVSDQDVQKSSLVQKLTAAGIAVDKATLLRNELPPVVNIAILLDLTETVRRMRDEESERQLAKVRLNLNALPAPTPTPES